jgi:arsenite methyltransferase
LSQESPDPGLKEEIRKHYAKRAVAVGEGALCGCGCGCGCGGAEVVAQDEQARGLYSVDEATNLPTEAVLASLGCGNSITTGCAVPASWTSPSR